MFISLESCSGHPPLLLNYYLKITSIKYFSQVMVRQVKGSSDLSAVRFSISDRQGDRGDGKLTINIINCALVA